MLTYIEHQKKQKNCLKAKFRRSSGVCDSANHESWTQRGVNWIVHEEAKRDDLIVSTDIKHYGKGLCNWNEMFSHG